MSQHQTSINANVNFSLQTLQLSQILSQYKIRTLNIVIVLRNIIVRIAWCRMAGCGWSSAGRLDQSQPRPAAASALLLILLQSL